MKEEKTLSRQMLSFINEAIISGTARPLLSLGTPKGEEVVEKMYERVLKSFNERPDSGVEFILKSTTALQNKSLVAIAKKWLRYLLVDETSRDSYPIWYKYLVFKVYELTANTTLAYQYSILQPCQKLMIILKVFTLQVR